MFAPQWVDCPAGTRILVLSPHFDDETLCCGGTLAKHVAHGASPTIVFMTDGKAGDYYNPDKESVMRQRKAEAREATSLLGIEKLILLDQPETNLKSHPGLIQELKDIFLAEKPDVVYLPTFVDNHIDHLQINQILSDLREVMGEEFNFTVNGFEAWTPIAPNLLVDITDVIAIKREAIRKYESQLKYVDYENGAVGLNAYRGTGYVGRGRFAEGFLSLPANEYVNLFRECSMKNVRYLDRRLKQRLVLIRNTFMARRTKT